MKLNIKFRMGVEWSDFRAYPKTCYTSFHLPHTDILFGPSNRMNPLDYEMLIAMKYRDTDFEKLPQLNVLMCMIMKKIGAETLRFRYWPEMTKFFLEEIMKWTEEDSENYKLCREHIQFEAPRIDLFAGDELAYLPVNIHYSKCRDRYCHCK